MKHRWWHWFWVYPGTDFNKDGWTLVGKKCLYCGHFEIEDYVWEQDRPRPPVTDATQILRMRYADSKGKDT